MEVHGIQTLPQEVFHMILDHLGHNKPTLRSCSLVCHTWSAASRPRLFATVSRYAHEGRLLKFLEFLEGHSDIAGYIRSLILHNPMDDNSTSVDGAPGASVTSRTLARIARRLSRLRDYQLYFVHVAPGSGTCERSDTASDGDHGAALDRLPRAPPVELGVFHLFGTSRQETGPFIELLSHFRIDRLELERVTFVQAPRTGTIDHAARVEVRDLWTDLDTADDAPMAILSALAPALAPVTLKAFHCHWQEWSGCGPVGAFLRAAGHTLSDLALHMPVPSWVEDRGEAIPREDWATLGLAACAAVRTFRTSTALPLVCAPADVAGTKRKVASFRALLGTLPPSVQTVVLDMSSVAQKPPPPRGRAAPRIVAVDFGEIEDALVRLPELRAVVVVMRAPRAALAVQQAFPTLHARGYLEVRSGSLLGARYEFGVLVPFARCSAY